MFFSPVLRRIRRYSILPPKSVSAFAQAIKYLHLPPHCPPSLVLCSYTGPHGMAYLQSAPPCTPPPRFEVQVREVPNLCKCVVQACQALGCMEHRGACSADNDSGDGSGIMTQVPWEVIEADVGPVNRETTG